MYIEEKINGKIVSTMLEQWRAWNCKIEIPSSKKQKQFGTKWVFIIRNQFGYELARLKRAKENNYWVIRYEG